MSENTPETKEILIGDLAVQLGLITKEDLDLALKKQLQLKGLCIYRPIGTILVELNKLTQDELKELINRQSQMWEGNRVLGKYRLLAKIGEGGMGAVWKAVHLELGNSVAIKLLPRAVIQDEDMVTRFEREARIMATVNHTNIVNAFDAGETEGQPYFVMPFINGATLGEVTRSCGVIGIRTALSIGLQIVRGLHYAHQRGIIHRDLKPDNIAITNDGTVKILDLGLTKLMESTTVNKEFATGSRMILGTPYHMSPEQILCDPNVDGRTDLYSLGSTLFQMVCGRVPFQADTVIQVLRLKLDKPPPDPRDYCPSITTGARRLILRLMARDRDQRPPTAQKVESWIEELLERRPITGSSLSPGKIAMGLSEKEPKRDSNDPYQSAWRKSTRMLFLSGEEHYQDPSSTTLIPKMPETKRVMPSDSKKDEKGTSLVTQKDVRSMESTKVSPSPKETAPKRKEKADMKSGTTVREEFQSALEIVKPAQKPEPADRAGWFSQLIAATVLIVITIFITLAIVKSIDSKPSPMDKGSSKDK